MPLQASHFDFFFFSTDTHLDTHTLSTVSGLAILVSPSAASAEVVLLLFCLCACVRKCLWSVRYPCIPLYGLGPDAKRNLIRINTTTTNNPLWLLQDHTKSLHEALNRPIRRRRLPGLFYKSWRRLKPTTIFHIAPRLKLPRPPLVVVKRPKPFVRYPRNASLLRLLPI